VGGSIVLTNACVRFDSFRARIGPHKQRECLPLCLILRNRLKYALTYKEVTSILQQRVVKVDGKIRMDKCFPCGIMGAFFASSSMSMFCSSFVAIRAGAWARENPKLTARALVPRRRRRVD